MKITKIDLDLIRGVNFLAQRARLLSKLNELCYKQTIPEWVLEQFKQLVFSSLFP